MEKIRVWFADKSVSLRSKPMVADCAALECIGSSDLSNGALERIQAAQPDVLVLALDGHDRRINHILHVCAQTMPATRILACSASQDKRFVMRLLRLGVDAYLSQGELSTELERAVKAIMQGDVFLCPSASGALVTEYRRHARQRRLPTTNRPTPTQHPMEKAK